MGKLGVVVLVAALGLSGEALAAGTTNSVKIQVKHKARVGQHLRVTFSGNDSSPSNAEGTFLDAVLEPPLHKGGSTCRSDLSKTEQNHPKSEELVREKVLDPHHTGHYRLAVSVPVFHVSGTGGFARGNTTTRA